MAKHGPKPEISHQELAKIASVVLHYLDNNQSYGIPGLLRIAANEEAIVTLSKELKKLKDKPGDIHKQLEKKAIGKTALDAHTYVGVLKRAIMENGNTALVSSNEAWDTIRNVLKQTNFGDPKQVRTCLNAFDLAIYELYHSPSQQDKDAAFVLYTLLHICTQIADNKDTNQMTPLNCSIVIGPGLGEILASPKNATHPLDLVQMMSLSKDLTQNLIESRRYALPIEVGIQYIGLSPAQAAIELKKNNSMIESIKAKINQETHKKGFEGVIPHYEQMLKALIEQNALLSELSGDQHSRSDPSD